MRTYSNSGKMAASKVKKSEKSCLRKIYINCIAVLLAGLFVGLATAQQAPAAKAPAAQNAPAAKAPTAQEAPSPGYDTRLWNPPAAKAPAAQKAPAAKPPAAQEPSPFKTPAEKRSYALGMETGGPLRNNSVEVDTDLFIKGFKDAISGGKTLLTEEDARAAVTELSVEQRRKMKEAKAAEAEKNKKDGEVFLAENKKKEGVVTLPSGLQYKILKTGEGKKPAAEDTVVCNYSGTLLNGTEFDSSYKRNQPITSPVKGVIKGWTEALQLMPVGSKWQLFIPSDLAYGEHGAGMTIAPNATLIFEVELLSIQETPKPAESAKY
jgi:FKBP-type peptidyl-prolyl cis-trans isomerase